MTDNIEVEISQKKEIKLEPKAQIYMNNLETIVSLGSQSRELSSLWTQNRDRFFIKLASWLETNLGSTNSSLIYNDLKELKNEDEKPQLTKSILTKSQSEKNESESQGESEDENTPCAWKRSDLSQAHEQLFTQYEPKLKELPGILELTESSYTLGGSLKGSPFLIMGHINGCNSLQQSLVQALFKEIHFLTV